MSDSLFSIQDEFVKNIIRDTIETYSGQWRIIHEAIQNAHDAIQLNPNITKGEIRVDLHLGTNFVRVSDNGRGISISKFKNVFLLGGSDKTTQSQARQILKGSQGVGIKATLFTSKYFKVETISDDTHWNITLNDCYKYLEQDFQHELPAPTSVKTSKSSGTTIEYSLEDFSVIDFINEVLEEHLEEVHFHEDDISKVDFKPDDFLKLLEVYFRTKTYIGCVQSLLGVNVDLKPVEVNVELHFDAPSLNQHRELVIKHANFSGEDSYHGKVLNHKFPGKYLDFQQVHNSLKKEHKVDKLYNSFEDVLNNPPSETMKKLLIQKFDKDQAKRLLYRSKVKPDGARELIVDNALDHKHRRVLSMLNGIYLVIGPRPYLSKYFLISTKQLLSVNGLPTNIVLNPPRGALSYLNNVHILIDVNAKLGFGKRNIPGRTMGLINNFFVDIWSMLRKIAPAIVGMREGKEPTDRNKWDKEVEYDNYQDKANVIRTKPLTFRNVPKEEQEVIVLFFELLGRKVITGYFPFRMGINSMYDGLFYIDEAARDKMPDNIKPRLLKNIEFKLNLSQLIKDFEEEEKFIEDIDLAICWDNDCNELDGEYLLSALDRDNITPLPAATYRVRKGTNDCQIIVLKDFLNNLELR